MIKVDNNLRMVERIKCMKEYALYKGDELLGVGTLKELSKQFGVKIKSLLFYQTPAYKKRTSDEKGKRLVRC